MGLLCRYDELFGLDLSGSGIAHWVVLGWVEKNDHVHLRIEQCSRYTNRWDERNFHLLQVVAA